MVYPFRLWLKSCFFCIKFLNFSDLLDFTISVINKYTVGMNTNSTGAELGAAAGCNGISVGVYVPAAGAASVPMFK